MVCFDMFHFKMCFAPQQCAFFDITTSKSAPKMACFDNFHGQLCFMPQRRALFRHLKSRKWSENGVFWYFSKPGVCHNCVHCFDISTSKIVPKPSFLTLLFKCVSMCLAPHRVQIFILHVPRCLGTRSFSEPTLRPSGTTNSGKNTEFRDVLTFFAHLHLLSLDFLLLWPSPCLSFFLAVLSTCPYCWKFDF